MICSMRSAHTSWNPSHDTAANPIIVVRPHTPLIYVVSLLKPQSHMTIAGPRSLWQTYSGKAVQKSVRTVGVFCMLQQGPV